MIYVGADLKFAINIECEGFSMDENDFTIELRNGRKSKIISKNDMVEGENNQWLLCFNSKELGAGDITIIVYAHVPDADFADDERTEVYKDILCHIEGI